MRLLRALAVHAVGAAVCAACATSPRAVGAPPTTTSPSPPPSPRIERGTFSIMRGTDTVAVEHFARGADTLQAELTIPAAGRVRYEASLQPDATVRRIVVNVTLADTTMPAQRSVAEFKGDTVLLERSGGPTPTERRAVPPGTIPYINPSPSLMEQIVRRARVVGGDSVTVPVLAAGNRSQVLTATVTHPSPDSALLTLGSIEVRLAVDTEGRVRGGSVPSQGIAIVRREAPLP